jgi:hypothetical protein
MGLWERSAGICRAAGSDAIDGQAIGPARTPFVVDHLLSDYAVLGYLFFIMAGLADIGRAVIAQLLMVLLYVPYADACPPFYAEIFPTRVRYTAPSIGYNLAGAILAASRRLSARFWCR